MFICLPLFFPISSSKCAKSRFKLLLRSPDLRSVPTRSAPSQSGGQGEALARRALVRGPARVQAAAAQADMQERCWFTPTARPPGKAGPECCCRGAAVSPPKHRRGQRGRPRTPSPVAGCGGEGAAAARGQQPSTAKANKSSASRLGREGTRLPMTARRGWASAARSQAALSPAGARGLRGPVRSRCLGRGRDRGGEAGGGVAAPENAGRIRAAELPD